MNITDLINEALISIDLKSTNKEDAIKELVTIIDKSGRIDNKDLYLSDVLKRENEISTGIGNGIAIPHGKSIAVKEASLALGISKSGIDFNSLDGEPVYIIFLIAAPEKADNLHLKVLSSLSRKLMHKEFIEALKNAKSTNEIIDVLNN